MSSGTEQGIPATIMFTDMVGYSALALRDEKMALEFLEEHAPNAWLLKVDLIFENPRSLQGFQNLPRKINAE